MQCLVRFIDWLHSSSTFSIYTNNIVYDVWHEYDPAFVSSFEAIIYLEQKMSWTSSCFVFYFQIILKLGWSLDNFWWSN